MANRTRKKISTKKPSYVNVEPGLGMEVEDLITGFCGTVTGKSEFLNGCLRISVEGRYDKKAGRQPDALWIDIQQARVTKENTEARRRYLARKETAHPGGPRPDAQRRVDPPGRRSL